jgi:hypothetical protein
MQDKTLYYTEFCERQTMSEVSKGEKVKPGLNHSKRFSKAS